MREHQPKAIPDTVLLCPLPQGPGPGIIHWEGKPPPETNASLLDNNHILPQCLEFIEVKEFNSKLKHILFELMEKSWDSGEYITITM